MKSCRGCVGAQSKGEEIGKSGNLVILQMEPPAYRDEFANDRITKYFSLDKMSETNDGWLFHVITGHLCLEVPGSLGEPDRLKFL